MHISIGDWLNPAHDPCSALMCKPVGDTERSALQDALRKVSVFSLLGVCPVVAMLLPWISTTELDVVNGHSLFFGGLAREDACQISLVRFGRASALLRVNFSQSRPFDCLSATFFQKLQRMIYSSRRKTLVLSTCLRRSSQKYNLHHPFDFRFSSAANA